MASIAFVQKRITGKEKELDKLNKKLERIRKVEAQNWADPNPYYYNEYDLKRCLKDIDEAQKALAGYKAQLAEEEEKAQSRNVPAILEFLEAWKQRVFEYYDSDLKAAHAELAEVKELSRQLAGKRYGSPEYKEAHEKYTTLHAAYYAKMHGYYRELTPEEMKSLRARNIYKYREKIRDGEWEHLGHYFERTYEESVAKLQRELAEEANRKYDFIIERTTAITGKITDAAALRVGGKGDLNGYIIGEKGSAKVQTIGAGGYNIQCYHFRTLINELK